MRLDDTFSKLKEQNRKAFIAYVAAGDPNFRSSLDIMHALSATGADVIELGLPFSDPLADGIVNQMAADRALKAGMSTARTLDLIREFRTKNDNTPIVLFTYLNPIFTYGFSKFQADAVEAGADGILLLDLPPDEAELSSELAENDKLSHIRLIAPSTPPERVKMLAEKAEGFIYALSRTGVTGGHSAPSETIPQQVAAIKEHTAIPVCVGFGISNPEQAKMVAESADGIIVGSAIVKQVENNQDNPAQAVSDFTKPLVDAIR
ncbi:MAG: tryptophan synthase subunit alpha [Akkermansiaceae bacterium]